MKSCEIRQSFLDFFHSQKHTIVPSSSLLPQSPNLLFTNAGMNQFVPIFLGQQKPDVDKWANALPGLPTRAADTQKCIRAGGKHNDLEDVGLDTYHHTFFEMLGNWSFGDYFKKEAIDWAWELVVEKWKFPAPRLYATIYQPDPDRGDPAERDQEAWDMWAAKFRGVGLDPQVHIVSGNKKDNFWMMGETGPCGPCSELHVNLLPEIDEVRDRALVNAGSPHCIEIWNLVFIQFNANPDGTFSALPARHVDTGMGFERVTSIIQGTKNFTDFTQGRISNYETDIFRPLFDAIEELSGKSYGSTLPRPGSTGESEQEKIDVAFRVIADHIRTLSFAIADGIQPGNTDRHYVLRRILRRAVRYGRSLGFQQPFLYKLVDALAAHMGTVFPELKTRQVQVRETIRAEEESFHKTLDRGLGFFQEELAKLASDASAPRRFSAAFTFKLYDTYGFPRDLTELMAREHGYTVDTEGFDRLMEEQKRKSKESRKRSVIELSQIDGAHRTLFHGYHELQGEAAVLEVVHWKDRLAVITDRSPFYAEMGGQVGDRGVLIANGTAYPVVDTQKLGNAWLHLLEDAPITDWPATVLLCVETGRREAIQRHHTATHLLHWALHEVVSRDATQKGSFVNEEKLTFDFNSLPLTSEQISSLERLVNQRILANSPVFWQERPYAEIKGRPEVMQFFGEKYGETVRIVQIGGSPDQLNGYSMELCGGTHVRATGEIGLFRIVGEYAIAAGTRRIEAVAGLAAYAYDTSRHEIIKSLAEKFSCSPEELTSRIDAQSEHLRALEKELKAYKSREAHRQAEALVEAASFCQGIGKVVAAKLEVESGEELRHLASAILKKLGEGIVVLGTEIDGKASLVAASSPGAQAAGLKAGDVVRELCQQLGGKGGGKPDFAMGGGKDASELTNVLHNWRKRLS